MGLGFVYGGGDHGLLFLFLFFDFMMLMVGV